ncbi:MAG TPA: hypothetical protein VIJ14_07705, partial [Rhabdochlamydiaceae bacterium]
NSSSSKAVIGFAVVAALGVGTALFYRSRKNTAGQPATPSLAQKDVSILRSIPGIGRAVNYFFPMKAVELPILSIGSSGHRFTSIDELTSMLEGTKKQHKELSTLIIYGNKLSITQDPGILALNPMKLILVSTYIIPGNEDTALDNLMAAHGWFVDPSKVAVDGEPKVTVIEVASVEEAVKAVAVINPATSKPYHMVYSVRA